MLTHKRTLVFLSVFVELMMTFCKTQKQKYVCIAAFLKEAGEPSRRHFTLETDSVERSVTKKITPGLSPNV